MVVMIEDERVRVVRLKVRDIEELIRVLNIQPHDIYDFSGYDKLIEKLKDGVKNG